MKIAIASLLHLRLSSSWTKRAVACALIVAALASCSDSAEKASESKEKTREEKAMELVSKAEAASAAGDYVTLQALLDSIEKMRVAPARRKAMALRAQAIEGLTELEILQQDSVLAMAEIELQSVSGRIRKVSADGETYSTASGSMNITPGNNGVQGRVDGNLLFGIAVSTSAPGPISSATLSVAGQSASTSAIAKGSDQSVPYGGGCLAIWSDQSADELGQLAAEHSGQAGTLSVNGIGGKRIASISLSADQMKAIGDTWRYSHYMEARNKAAIERDFLERKLAVARNQRANSEFAH